MGRLYDLIKKDVEELKKFVALEKTNFLASRKYDVVLKAYENAKIIRSLTSSIDNNGIKIFGSSNNYITFLEEEIQKGLSFLPTYLFDENSEVADYETIINKIEEKLNDEQINDIIKTFNKNKAKAFSAPLHIYDEKIGEIKNEINTFNNDLISNEEKNEIIESLNFLNEVLIKKTDDAYIDKVIDISSRSWDSESLKHTDEFVIKNNVNLDNLPEADKDKTIIQISPTNIKNNNVIKPLLNKKLILNPNYVKKILDLDKVIKDNNILNSGVAGESAFKEYGFLDWFRKAREAKDELNKYINSNETDKTKRIENLRIINNKAKELKDITKKYDNVLNYIKDNFDLSKNSLPSNVYSGRLKNNFDNLDFYTPDLPEMFDGKNAPYGSILNGYSQIKTFCSIGNLTLEEFLNDPLNSLLNICKDEIQNIDNNYILPKDNNSLGKRMAHILVEPKKAYFIINGFVNSTRCFEAVNKLADLDENTYDNLILSTVSSQYINPLNHSGENLFGLDIDKLTNLKNLFALGNNEDNLLSLSNRYMDNNFNYQDINAKYEERIASLANADPTLECNRIIDILSDYFIERKKIYDTTHLVDDDLNDSFKSGKIFAAAKDYFSDYLYKNNIDLNNIRNPEERKRLIEFSKNPVKTFSKEFNRKENIFVERHREDFEEFNYQYAIIYERMHKDELTNFVSSFNQNNNTLNGYNSGKGIRTILNDNKGGIWERFIARSTSNEYKSLVDAINDALNNEAPNYGDLAPVKFYAKKYLDYKLRNKNINDLSTTSKRRVEFCKTILKSFNELDDKYEIKINQPLNDLKEPKINNDLDFQNEIKDNLNKENSIETLKENIDDNQKEIIEIKKDDL